MTTRSSTAASRSLSSSPRILAPPLYAASLVRVEYEVADHATDLAHKRGEAYVPKQKRTGVSPPPTPRGDAAKAYADAPVRVENEYRVAIEHHNPMEMHATTVVWEGDGKITVHDKIQGVQNCQGYITGVFGLSTADVRVIAPFVGGAFGSGLRPQYQLFLAVMAARELKRSVRVVLTRDQMFTFGYRPDTINQVMLGAKSDGALQVIRHDAIAGTSTFEDYQEVVVNWSGLLYHSDNVALTYKLAQIDTYSPCDMRAPGAPLGVFALESAMDELAYALHVDPLALRLQNYAETDENEGKQWTSKELRAGLQLAAERFGWSKRSAEPRSMRDGRELVGWGMACGIWEAQMQKTSARATLTADGKLEVASATADIGTGTYTILTQIAADALGLPMDSVTAKLGDSSLPTSPVEGGSWTAASAGSAVQAACHAVREKLFRYARAAEDSPLANADLDHVAFVGGRIQLTANPSRHVTIADAMRAGRVERIEEEETTGPDAAIQKRYSAYTHSAIFAEVKVDEDLGVVRVTRIVDAVAAGKILNPKTARSQIIGGVVFGIGMALTEETLLDHKLGRIHEPQLRRVPRASERRHPRHRRDLRERARRQGEPDRRQGIGRDRHRRDRRGDRQRGLPCNRQACSRTPDHARQAALKAEDSLHGDLIWTPSNGDRRNRFRHLRAGRKAHPEEPCPSDGFGAEGALIVVDGGRTWDRTTDLLRVREALSR